MRERPFIAAVALSALVLLIAGCAKTVRVPPPLRIAEDRVWESPINWHLSATLSTEAPPPPPSPLTEAQAYLERSDWQGAAEIYRKFCLTNPPGKERDYAQFNLAVMQTLSQEYPAAQESLKGLSATADYTVRAAADSLGRLIEERNTLEREKQEQRELAEKLDRRVRSLKRTIDEKERAIEERERAVDEKERALQESLDKLKRLILEPPPSPSRF